MNGKATGPARELVNLVEQVGVRLVVSPFILNEVERVLRYSRIQSLDRLSDDEIREHLHCIESLAGIVLPLEGPPVVLRDPNDDPIVYTAL